MAPGAPMAEHRIEIELKYAAESSARHALVVAERLGPARLGPVVVNDETDVYLDTPDGHLARAAWACRLRTRRVAGASTVRISLKGPATAVVGGMHRRPEVEGPATHSIDPAAWPRSPARDLLDALRAGEPLAEVLTLQQRRRERDVLNARGGLIGILSIDEARVRRLGTELGILSAVELELAPGRVAAELAPFATALTTLPGLTPDARSKLEHALDMARDITAARG